MHRGLYVVSTHPYGFLCCFALCVIKLLPSGQKSPSWKGPEVCKGQGSCWGLWAGAVWYPGCGRAGHTHDGKDNSTPFPPCTADLFVVTFLRVCVAKPQHRGAAGKGWQTWPEEQLLLGAALGVCVLTEQSSGSASSAGNAPGTGRAHEPIPEFPSLGRAQHCRTGPTSAPQTGVLL